MKKKILVAGLGYVGLANALLLSQENQVVAYDIDEEKLKQLKKRKSPLDEEDIHLFLQKKELNIVFTNRFAAAVLESEIMVIATPTNYDEYTNYFDTSSVEQVIDQAIQINPAIKIVIKSTIPVGFVDEMKARYPEVVLAFSPEFLREGKALYDNLRPSRIIVGDEGKFGELVAQLFLACAINKNTNILLTTAKEAEAIKLFSNSYLALRIAYFNELDTFAEESHLRSSKIIKGMSFDPRIGDYYNNPSFGYGGYCLPKDTKQLAADFSGIPHSLVHAIVTSNTIRITHIAQKIAESGAQTIGVYKLAMKHHSDNFRYSSTLAVIDRLVELGKEIVIYEPSLSAENYKGHQVVKNISELEEKSDVIIANRYEAELKNSKKEIYTRDIFQRD
ncbi:MAG: nucleotide sugar dehydrogenase [Enterococcus lacertideformus]|uniref:UDP-glucose 6-dehydrogenase n=1 Tax=Enterococcus lacertideformus TaxID=2771493 RepID=A0A931AXQ0_9ENTE|nr:nucleotide sugar dehydrogenase [Enterococcus lacertideformus]